MSPSSSSCFKIIACGRNSAANDGVERIESKGSTDKRGWSFRKRSARHRVLNNNVSLELPSADSKESPEATATGFDAQRNHSVPENVSTSQGTYDPPPFSSAAVNSKASECSLSTVKPSNFENPGNCDSKVQESVAIVLQTAIRGYLAERSLSKLKNVVKLQAAVRGYLVRRHAVGTLRCVQAIVKMQALVRARRASQSVEGLAVQKELNENNQGQENSGYEANMMYSCSTNRLLANGFARQLLETKPKRKPILIKCNSSKASSAWQWLERWMAASSSVILESENSKLNVHNQEPGEKTKPAITEMGAEDMFESDTKETGKVVDVEEMQRASNADDFDFQSCNLTPLLHKSPSSAVADNIEDLGPGDAGSGSRHECNAKNSKVIQENPESLSNCIPTQSNATLELSRTFVFDKPGVGIEKSMFTVKSGASEPIATDGKKVVLGSRKASNPAFAAAQSKFEELSSSAASGRSIGSYHDVELELRFESPQIDSVTSAAKTTDFSVREDSVSNDPRVQVEGSECGTELSVTSTLDSPDGYEVESGELMLDARAVNKVGPDPNFTFYSQLDLGNLDGECEAMKPVVSKIPSVSSDIIDPPRQTVEVNGDSAVSVTALNPTQQESQALEHPELDRQIKHKNVTDRSLDRLSPEGSPRSRITAPDSLQGTPSSQISVGAKSSKSNNSKPKQRPQSLGTRSPSNPNLDSTGRNSSEHLLKDPKNGKRRKSFDYEAGESSSHNSLPSYMQVTESARAKIHRHNSPKSSPDLHDKDVYSKKRHSLPVTNEKQGSPRIQRSMSQAQQNAKGNSTHSPHTERKWQR